MPTGYTYAVIEKDITFEQFVMSCARAFGACITMRDDDPDAPIPEAFAPSDYHINALEEAKAKIARLEGMNPDKQVAFGLAAIKADKTMWRESLERTHTTNAKLQAMLEKVLAWSVPITHQGIKDFMAEQLRISFDHPEYAVKHLAELETETPQNVYAAALANARRDVEYHELEWQKELARTAERNEWLRVLRESLNGRTE